MQKLLQPFRYKSTKLHVTAIKNTILRPIECHKLMQKPPWTIKYKVQWTWLWILWFFQHKKYNGLLDNYTQNKCHLTTSLSIKWPLTNVRNQPRRSRTSVSIKAKLIGHKYCWEGRHIWLRFITNNDECVSMLDVSAAFLKKSTTNPSL